MNTQIIKGISITKIVIIAFLFLMLACNKDDDKSENDVVNTENEENASDDSTLNSANAIEMQLNFEFANSGASYESSDIYVAWIENTNKDFTQTITVCERLVNNTLTGIVLPYWKVNKYPSSKEEVDAVTSATIKDQSFSVDFTLKDSTIKEFSVFFEIDRCNDYNDWFTDKRDQGAPNYVQDQPAILYKADVNLNDTSIKSYELELYAWTPNDDTEKIIVGMVTGTRVLETRYITCKKNGEVFGDWDNEHRSDRMVGSISLIIK